MLGTLTSYTSSDLETYPPPRQRRRRNTPRIIYDGQDVQVTVHRTVECDVQLPLPFSSELGKHPLPPPAHEGITPSAAIVLKDVSHASGSRSSTVGSNSGFEGTESGAM